MYLTYYLHWVDFVPPMSHMTYRALTKYNLPLHLSQWQTWPQEASDITVFKPYVIFPQFAKNRSTFEALYFTFCNICASFPRLGVVSPLSHLKVLQCFFVIFSTTFYAWKLFLLMQLEDFPLSEWQTQRRWWKNKLPILFWKVRYPVCRSVRVLVLHKTERLGDFNWHFKFLLSQSLKRNCY
jgi:hypothetical protein